MVKAGRSSSASGSGRRSKRRSSRAPHVQAAETSPSIEDRLAVRADTAAAQDGLTPQLIYRSQLYRSVHKIVHKSISRNSPRHPLATRMITSLRLSPWPRRPIATASVPVRSVPRDDAADGGGADDEEAIGAADDGAADDARAAQAALAVRLRNQRGLP
jgi:hypothetical protein